MNIIDERMDERVSNKVYDFGNFREFKVNMAVGEYEKNIPDVAEKQVEFAKKMTEKIFDLDLDNKIEVNYNRCGMGKSTLIKAILNQLVNNYLYMGEVPRKWQKDPFNYGAIVITDRLERLEDIANYRTNGNEGLYDRCYLMKYAKEDEEQLYKNQRKEFLEQLQEQSKYPIVLISTQKYFKMKESERKLLYKWNNGTRRLLMCDEKPPIISTEIIDERYLSNIKVALEELPKGEDKLELIEYWNSFYSYIDNIRDNYTEYDINWICGSGNDCLISPATDKKFFKKLEELASTKLYDSIVKLKEINKNGCLFISNGDKDQDNSRKFVLINNNTDKFDTDLCKTIIFDATAMEDIDYTISDKYNIFKFDDSKESDINLHYITVTTSQGRLKANQKHVENIAKYINELSDDLFVATYGKKSGIFQKFSSLLNTKDIAYFGDIKGKNNWNDKSEMAQIGLNRKSHDVYLATYIALTNVDEKWNKIQDSDKIYEDIVSILESDNGNFVNKKMQRIMESDLVVDSVQNIMRIKCRHFNNRDKCNVFLLCAKVYCTAIESIEKSIGAKKLEYTPDMFVEAREQDRNKKDGTKTNNQKFKEWFESWEGEKVEVKEVKTILDIKDKAWEKLKKSATWNNLSNEFGIEREGRKFYLVRK